MNYYIVEPEVAGEIGKNTVYDKKKKNIDGNEKIEIIFLHFIFDGWLGDELLEVTPCFLVSERLKNEIIKNNLSGCVFQEIKQSYGDVFMELYPNIKVPKFFRLIPINYLNVDEDKYIENNDMSDFMISQKDYLIISENAKKIILNNSNIKNSEFTLIKK